MDLIKVLRYMEWERAKGSLRAILASYTSSSGTEYEDWKELNAFLETFLNEFGERSGID